MSPKVQPPEIEGHRFVDHLGSGGYSEVFRYEEIALRRMVAVKVLLEGASEDEARTMAAVASHSYVVDVYGIGVTREGYPYLRMQLYSGPNFAQRLSNGPLPIPEVLQLGVHMCGALEWAHRQGVLHRDIKPANILTSETGRPGLADFGIASAGGVTTEQQGASIPWVAPEVLESRPATVVCDVYSLAATLYTLSQGHPPFVIPGGDNRDQLVMKRTLSDRPQPPSAGTPESLVALFRRALSREPGGRPQTAEALGRALQAVETDLRLPQTPLEIPLASAAPVDRSTTEATRARGVRMVAAEPVDDATKTRTRLSSGLIDAVDLKDRRSASGKRRTVGLEVPVAEPTAAPLSDKEMSGDPGRRSTRWLLVGAAVLLAILVAVGVMNRRSNPASPAVSDDPFATPSVDTRAVLPVRDLVVERAPDGTVTASWSAPRNGADSRYSWRRCDDAVTGSGTAESGVISETSVAVQGVPSDQQPCVGVVAIDANGVSSREVRGRGKNQ
jgi:serine/threonine protein kinase